VEEWACDESQANNHNHIHLGMNHDKSKQFFLPTVQCSVKFLYLICPLFVVIATLIISCIQYVCIKRLGGKSLLFYEQLRQCMLFLIVHINMVFNWRCESVQHKYKSVVKKLQIHMCIACEYFPHMVHAWQATSFQSANNNKLRFFWNGNNLHDEYGYWVKLLFG
jgi:hypothetical protein